MTESPSQRLARAEAHAVRAHGDQRYGTHPYRYHLVRVVSIAQEFAVEDPDVPVAAWLHDCIEDTDETKARIADAFGERVAALVWAVTDAPGADHHARHQATYPKIAREPGAVTLKLCDRLANTRQCLTLDSPESQRKLARYRAEYPGFRDALWHDPAGATARLWDVLDVLNMHPFEGTSPQEHPAYREFYRQLSPVYPPGTSSRVIMENLDQDGAEAGLWLRAYGPPEVIETVRQELRQRCTSSAGDRRVTGADGHALQVLLRT